jgi:hypothetical protein
MYVPGYTNDLKFLKAIEEASIESDFNDIVFFKAHCRKHINFCMSKTTGNRIGPYAEVYYINEEDQIELADMGEWHRSVPGIRGFL